MHRIGKLSERIKLLDIFVLLVIFTILNMFVPKRVIITQHYVDGIMTPQKVANLYYSSEYYKNAMKLFKSAEELKHRASFYRAIRSCVENKRGFIDIDYMEEPEKKGWKDGLQYCGSNKDMLQEITLEDYGYTYVEAEGTYRVGFELSEFTESKTGERWWLEVTSDFVPLFSNVGSFRVKGFLSPLNLGSYGHLGGWNREIIVDNMTEL